MLRLLRGTRLPINHAMFRRATAGEKIIATGIKTDTAKLISEIRVAETPSSLLERLYQKLPKGNMQANCRFWQF